MTANNAHPLWFFHRWVGILRFQAGWDPFFDDLAGVDDGRIHQPGDDAVCGRLFSRPP